MFVHNNGLIQQVTVVASGVVCSRGLKTRRCDGSSGERVNVDSQLNEQRTSLSQLHKMRINSTGAFLLITLHLTLCQILCLHQ